MYYNIIFEDLKAKRLILNSQKIDKPFPINQNQNKYKQ